VYLDLRTAAEWARFVASTRFEPPVAPLVIARCLAGQPDEREGDLANALAALFSTREAAAWESDLAPAGLGCVQADAVNTGGFFAGEAHPGSEWMVPVTHPELGTYYRHAPMVSFDVPNARLQAGVRAGVDGAALLGELGYAPDEIEHLFVDGVLYSADRDATPAGAG
jgi:crotonobetainyl-CoA:carnitine CoA-transferase CaiB-like acyl-CoA transferase